jgi:membrane protein
MIPGWLAFIVRFFRRSSDHDVRGRAATMAFYLLLALFPTLLGLLGILGSFDLEREVGLLSTMIGDVLPQEAAALVVGEVERMADVEVARPLSLSLVFAVYYAGRAVGVVYRGVHQAWDIRPRHRWLWVRGVAAAVAGVGLIAAVAVLVSLRLAAWVLEELGRFDGMAGTARAILTFYDWPILVFFFQQTTNLLYCTGARLKHGWRWWSWGSVLACAAWLITSWGYRLYLERFIDLGATYGSLGAAVGLLVYMHLVSWGVLSGAELDAMLHERRFTPPPGARSPRPRAGP